jgi:hypothetical protein
VSHRATFYVKELRVCPNREPVSKMEKLVLYALADYHQDKLGANTYPSVESLAEESMMDRRSCQRVLESAERKGVIERQRGEHQGRGHVTFYRFCELDRVAEKGGHGVALFGTKPEAVFLSERAAKGRQKGGKRAAKSPPPPNEEQEREQKQQVPVPPQPPAARGERARSGTQLSLDSEPSGRAQAMKRAMTACHFTALRIRRALDAVFNQREGLGESSEDIADKVIDAWERYGKQGRRLFRHRPPREFYESGMWLNSNNWDWNAAVLREEQESAKASFGTFQPS